MQVTRENLSAFLTEQGHAPQYQQETDQLYLILPILTHEVPLFINLQRADLLQLIAYIPYTLDSPRAGEMGRLLHVLNRELDLPGFGMDEAAGLLFYRCPIPTLDQQLDERLLKIYLVAVGIACELFIGVAEELRQGKSTLEGFIKKR